MQFQTIFSAQLRVPAVRLCWIVLAAATAAWGQIAFSAEPLAEIQRRLPPPGIVVPNEELSRLKQELVRVDSKLQKIADHSYLADVEIFTKAVSLAIRHNEFYRDRDVESAHRVLEVAARRIDALNTGASPWTKQRGLVVRGYRSAIDNSAQPYGVWIAEDVDLDSPVPLYVWLHGRGDKVTDLHFIRQRQSQTGYITPPGSIVLHPFGRQCIGYKSAGEIDVLESLEAVARDYKIDRDRVALMGFSMGGAGAWHLGAHYTQKWVAVSPGAGFAETLQYNRLRAGDFPSYEQKLWGVYDVPDYVRNLFNVDVVAYSGENDKQIQAARMMEQAYLREGRELTHLIGPGMGHKYHPDTLSAILAQVGAAVARGNNARPEKISLQTKTLRYGDMKWVSLRGLQEHWVDARVDASIEGARQLRVATQNVTQIRLSPWSDMAKTKIMIDGDSLTVSDLAGAYVDLDRQETWRELPADHTEARIRKRPGLQGPIDDLFLEPFLVVTPTGNCRSAIVEDWVTFELEHFQRRWRELFRGELRSKPDRAVTDEDLQSFHLVLWGDAQSNSIIQQIFTQHATELPITWSATAVEVGNKAFSAEDHLPVFIYLNPLNQERYVVFNSGPTFREAHDRTNSLQNPKLPDWAVIDLKQPPTAQTAGRIAAADFFDETWQLK